MIRKRRTVLQKARKAKGLTQKEVANLLGVQLRTYQHYEYGDRTPPLEKAVILANLMGIQVDDLLVRNYTTDSSETSASESASA